MDIIISVYVTVFWKTDHLRTLIIFIFREILISNIECNVLLLWSNTVTPDILYK